MPDKILIHNLKLPCRVGVPDAERKNPQTIEIDLELIRDLREAGASDNVAKTVDYAAVVSHLQKYLKDKEFKLLEKLAHDAALQVLDHFEADAIRIQIRKKALKETDWTGVELVREKRGPDRKLGF